MNENLRYASRVQVVSPSGASVSRFERTSDGKRWEVRGRDVKPLTMFWFSMKLNRWLKQGFAITIYDNVLNQVWEG